MLLHQLLLLQLLLLELGLLRLQLRLELRDLRVEVVDELLVLLLEACVLLVDLGRHALHSLETSFIHPHTQKELTVSAPLAEDMQTVVDLM